MRNLIAFIAGVIFALGLGVSGMTNTEIVRGFLDIFGNWNFNLIGVMGGAILSHSLVYYFVRHRSSPLLDVKFYFPKNKKIDKKLIGGAAIFGIGWGWAGICPGPGIVSLVSGKTEVFIFVFSMIVGIIFYKKIESKTL